MVYCQGGSLYNLLEQPQYGFGFPDDEFLTFLDHIGMCVWGGGGSHKSWCTIEIICMVIGLVDLSDSKNQSSILSIVNKIRAKKIMANN